MRGCYISWQLYYLPGEAQVPPVPTPEGQRYNGTTCQTAAQGVPSDQEG